MLRSIDYVTYSDLERYLFEHVHDRFDKDHSIGAFDFFSIVIWKANRAKSKVAKRLLEKAKPERNLERIVRQLTESLYQGQGPRERMRVLLKDWGFRLPMASAILTVLWPGEFTVYDIRVCGELQAFHNLAGLDDSDRTYDGYVDYLNAVRDAAPDGLSLRDKDRFLWARSVADQLARQIKNSFKAIESHEGELLGREP